MHLFNSLTNKLNTVEPMSDLPRRPYLVEHVHTSVVLQEYPQYLQVSLLACHQQWRPAILKRNSKYHWKKPKPRTPNSCITKLVLNPACRVNKEVVVLKHPLAPYVSLSENTFMILAFTESMVLADNCT